MVVFGVVFGLPTGPAVMATITAAEANRNFSALLRRVQQGETVVVTSRGRPVAKIAPVEPEAAEREAARRKLLERLRTQPVRVVGPWSREELYEDDPPKGDPQR